MTLHAFGGTNQDFFPTNKNVTTLYTTVEGHSRDHLPSVVPAGFSIMNKTRPHFNYPADLT
jgi:hypothetical protein